MLANLPKMSGREYLEWGTSLMLAKFGLDSFLCQFIFHRPWMFWNYFTPGAMGGVHWSDCGGCLVLFLHADVGSTFAYSGARFTLRRLNTVGLPPWMVILFFVPFINMIFFVLLRCS